MGHREEDTLRILVTTDNHLGYAERDPVRRLDSVATFEEVLQQAKDHNADMILLGGDLFHENKPSRVTMYKCIELLRHHCMGDRPCYLQILSDQAQNFSTKFGTVNFEDPNYNVAIPVFSIHGNHDDPSGDGQLCALDLLAACNLVNYFGKATTVDDISVSPILIQKGETKLALYGLGNVRDERLHQTYLANKVNMLRPDEDKDNWFNLFVLHQNRVKHGPSNYIPESFLPDFLDLVIWGHEHKCEIDAVQQAAKNFFITQPGSTIATSLSEGEAVPKHCALLSIHKKEFLVEKIKLRTVRPFLMDELVLSEQRRLPKTAKPEEIAEVLEAKVKEMVRKAQEAYRQEAIDEGKDPDTQTPMKKPLIRLKVEYSGGYSIVNVQQFGQRFVNVVANPKDILQFFRKRESHKPSADGKPSAAMSTSEAMRERPDALSSAHVEDMVAQYLSSSHSLEILPERSMGEAIKAFVNKDEKDSIRDYVQFVLATIQDKLRTQQSSTEAEIVQRVTEVRSEAARDTGPLASQASQARSGKGAAAAPASGSARASAASSSSIAAALRRGAVARGVDEDEVDGGRMTGRGGGDEGEEEDEDFLRDDLPPTGMGTDFPPSPSPSPPPRSKGKKKQMSSDEASLSDGSASPPPKTKAPAKGKKVAAAPAKKAATTAAAAAKKKAPVVSLDDDEEDGGRAKAAPRGKASAAATSRAKAPAAPIASAVAMDAGSDEDVQITSSTPASSAASRRVLPMFAAAAARTAGVKRANSDEEDEPSSFDPTARGKKAGKRR